MVSIFRGALPLNWVASLQLNAAIESISASAAGWDSFLWMGKRDKRTWRGKIFKGSNGKMRLHPTKEKLFGAPPLSNEKIPVPPPPPHLATPKRFPPVEPGPAIRFDVPPELYQDPYEHEK
ncbi:hypothetical protein BSKO_03769 [Bryopsis sp. KO-2023]|nr:hypothetical protein BSKO_03769 [Bryopsis sp. KO-2023]